MSRRCFALLLAILMPAVAMGQQHPNQERGFAADKLYSVQGLDNVNVFNGNLTVTVPIGPKYKSNGNLSYAFTLVYSGNVWDYSISNSAPLITTVIPNRRSNAGVGWLFSLGRLIPPSDVTNETTPPLWLYESADGNDHILYPLLHGTGDGDGVHFYSRDSTYVRLTLVDDTTRQIEFPDGTSQLFRLLLPSNGEWPASVDSNSRWKLTAIRDRFNNEVGITYSTAVDPVTQVTYPEVWTVHDGSRTHSVYFVSASSPYTVLLDHVVLSAAGGATATYSFTQAYVSVERGWGDNSGANGFPGPPWNVPMLTAITLPLVNGSAPQYSMSLSGAPDYDVSGVTTGHLRGLHLPTGGWIEWDYAQFIFPTDSGSARRTRATGVTTRRLLDASRSTVGTWAYARKLSDRPGCTTGNGGGGVGPSAQLVASIVPPAGATELYYFSVYAQPVDGDPCPNSDGWDESEYGLPVSRGVKDSSGARFLSREWRTGVLSLTTGPGQYRVASGTLLRSNYTAFELEAGSSYAERSVYDTNKRVTTERTNYDDDNNCGGICFHATNHLGFDGFGHFRQSSDEGNFTGGKFRTRFTGHDGTLDVNNSWVLGTYGEACVADEMSSRAMTSSPLNSCAQLSNPSVGKFQFERSTGFLAKKRSLTASTLSSNDMLAVFARDANGNLLSESYFGGDTNPDGSLNTALGTADAFATSAPATYTINHSYSFNGGGSLTRHQAFYGGMPFFISDEDYDPSTGALAASRDTAQVGTEYTYDVRGRQTLIKPTGRAWTRITYTDAIPGSNNPTAQITRYPNGVTQGTPLTQTTYEFDALGRVIRERRLMPDGTTSNKATTYNAVNWATFVSGFETSDPPLHGTSYAYDSFGRPVEITRPDTLTPNKPPTTLAYAGRRLVERTISIGVPPVASTTREIYDSLGRLSSVQEPGSGGSPDSPNSVTDYIYDVADRLWTAQMAATGGPTQVRRFCYDGRGVMRWEQHPEIGVNGNGVITYGTGLPNDRTTCTATDAVTTAYDARGHATARSVDNANSPFDQHFVYDAAERLINVKSRSPYSSTDFLDAKQFTYASANSGLNLQQGKLITATRYNYQPTVGVGILTVTEQFTYNDAAGRLTNKQTGVDDGFNFNQQFSQSYAYNDLDQPVTINYPTCSPIPCGQPSWTTIHPGYTNGALSDLPGFTGTVPGGTTGVAFAPTGALRAIQHANGVLDTIAPDANGMARPAQITFSGTSTCTIPSLSSVTPSQSIPYNTAINLSVTASGSSPLSYQWFTNALTGNTINGATTSAYTTPPLTSITSYWVKVANSCGVVTSGTITITPVLPAPVGLDAHASVGVISVSWSNSNGAQYYEVQRRSNGGAFSLVASPSSTSWTDLSFATNTTYVYRVRALGSGGSISSPYSNNDLATSMNFSTITAGVTTVQSSHFSELLSALNNVRAANGSPPLQWTDILPAAQSAPSPGIVVYREHVAGLRTYMDLALQALGISISAYTDPTLNNTIPIKAVHIFDLRSRTQ